MSDEIDNIMQGYQAAQVSAAQEELDQDFARRVFHGTFMRQRDQILRPALNSLQQRLHGYGHTAYASMADQPLPGIPNVKVPAAAITITPKGRHLSSYELVFVPYFQYTMGLGANEDKILFMMNGKITKYFTLEEINEHDVNEILMLVLKKIFDPAKVN